MKVEWLIIFVVQVAALARMEEKPKTDDDEVSCGLPKGRCLELVDDMRNKSQRDGLDTLRRKIS